MVSKDVHVATLTNKSATLEIEVKIEKGIGYQLKDREEKDVEVGAILTDSIFTPVQKVSFRSENMRVGDRTDFDKLFLEIETDGTITPQKALRQSSDILSKHFDIILNTFKEEKEKKAAKKKQAKEPKVKAKKKTVKKAKKQDEKKN